MKKCGKTRLSMAAYFMILPAQATKSHAFDSINQPAREAIHFQGRNVGLAFRTVRKPRISKFNK